MLQINLNLLWTVINLVVWYILIRKFLFKPVNNIIDKREASIKSRYDEAQALKEEAKAEKDKCAAFQADMEEEKTKIVAAAQEDARMEYNQIVEDARKKADRIVEESKKEAQLQKEKIIGQAEQEIRSLIMDTAAKSLQSSGSDAALYDQFLTKAGETTHAEH